MADHETTAALERAVCDAAVAWHKARQHVIYNASDHAAAWEAEGAAFESFLAAIRALRAHREGRSDG